MSGTDDGDRPVTAAELADLRSAVETLQAENAELKAARTPAAREEAREGVRDAQADLDAVARSLGISREALDRATRDAKAAERKEELRPLLKDLLAEIQEENDAAAAAAAADDDAKGGAKPKPKPKPKDEPADDDKSDADGNGAGGDDGPTRKHWSEQRIGDLVK